MSEAIGLFQTGPLCVSFNGVSVDLRPTNDDENVPMPNLSRARKEAVFQGSGPAAIRANPTQQEKTRSGLLRGLPRACEFRTSRLRLMAEVYCSSFNSACGAELACARAATPACTRTCALLRLAASIARLASLIVDSAAASLVLCDWARLTA
jgi:hypothetical protein